MQMKSPTNQNFSALNTVVSEDEDQKKERESLRPMSWRTAIVIPLYNTIPDGQFETFLVVSLAARLGDSRRRE